jgi:hypothetical protein
MNDDKTDKKPAAKKPEAPAGGPLKVKAYFPGNGLVIRGSSWEAMEGTYDPATGAVTGKLGGSEVMVSFHQCRCLVPLR